MNKTVTTKQLHQSLNLQGYKCNKELAMQVCASLKQKPVGGAFLFGPAGAGKTHLPEVLQGILEADLHYYQVTQGTREEDLVQKILPADDTKTGVKIHPGILVKATEATHGNKLVILLLDEWDKTRHSADAFLLDFLQSGRISFPGVSVEANQENLLVFITLNDERELSEPLSRRLPKIDFKIMHPELIRSALTDTHNDNEFTDAAVALYERCIYAGVKKPITIQELRQLLDAVDLLEGDADWNTLVKQYVTKSDRNHKTLLEHESDSESDINRRLDRLFRKDVNSRIDVANYENNGIAVPEMVDENTEDTQMPKLKYIRNVDWKFAKYKTPKVQSLRAGSGIYGIIPYNNKTYDAYVHDFADFPKRSARDLPGPASVQGRYIIVRRPIPLMEAHKVRRLESIETEGELCFLMNDVPYHRIKEFQETCSSSTSYKFRIFKFSEAEIIGRIGTNVAEVRWINNARHNGRLEIIVNLQRWGFFKDAMCSCREYNKAGMLSGLWLSGKELRHACEDIDSDEYKVGWAVRRYYAKGWRKSRPWQE